MAGDTSSAFDGGQIFRGNPLPQGDSLTRLADLLGNPRHGAPLLTEQYDPCVHAAGKAHLDDGGQVRLDGPPCNIDAMTIGEKIRRKRQELDLSLQEVANAVGVSKNAVHLWETSERAEIKLANRIALSEFFEMPLIEFLPPQATERDLTISDPQEILVIERFRELQPQQREAWLRLLVVMHEDPGQVD